VASAFRSPASIDREGDGARAVDRLELLNLAEKAATVAVNLLRDSKMPVEPFPGTGGKGLVTALDRAVEECLREELAASRPNDGFLGEESPRLDGESEVEWIIDPIDGTNNFIAGLPHWSISIAARAQGAIEVGVIDAPALGLRYAAYAGGGARRNGHTLSARLEPGPDLADAVVATGFASGDAARAAQMSRLDRVLGKVRDVRCHGAASLELCGVASGQLDAYFESDLHIWDVAAAGLIATEVGVEVSGQPWSGDGALLAAPPGLAEALRRLIDQRGKHVSS
jgi:myo-inositol-1(or 4)-monophosphatase